MYYLAEKFSSDLDGNVHMQKETWAVVTVRKEIALVDGFLILHYKCQLHVLCRHVNVCI